MYMATSSSDMNPIAAEASSSSSVDSSSSLMANVAERSSSVAVPPPTSRLYRSSSSTSLNRYPRSTVGEDAQQVRMNVLSRGFEDAREARQTRLFLYITTGVNVPQILTSIVLLILYWSSSSSSSSVSSTSTACNRVKIWTVFHIVHMTLLLIVEWIVYGIQTNQLDGHIHFSRTQYRLLPRLSIPPTITVMQNLKYGLEVFGLFWFLLGNMWILNENETLCAQANPVLFKLALALVIVIYVRIFLPCLIILAILPVMCFCLPCLIRLLQHLQDPMRGKGATQDLIDGLDTRVFKKRENTNLSEEEEEEEEEEECCCICLTEYEENQVIRMLPCGHHYHRECVDEWLKVNATCPTCRTSIVPETAATNANSNSNSSSTHDPSLIV